MNRKARKGKRPKPDVEALRIDPAYRLVYELGFQDMVPFVMSQIKKKGFFSWLYMAVNVAILLFILIFSASGLIEHSMTWKKLMWQSVAGVVAGSILVIPVHELLHGLAYRVLGARNIIFGADPGQLIFFVTANRYPVSGAQVHLLALTPFVVINLSTILLTTLLFPGGTLFSAFFLLSHNIMCIGDFAISGFIARSGRKVYTFDEPEKKMSYFFEEL
ncbi:MAG: DUF3267 domain-containing protein [Bacteroidetes bacterium]|nr:DUF3267 domain-containing protein [Bacteroidota bacterium]